jgi:hypothetical protein
METARLIVLLAVILLLAGSTEPLRAQVVEETPSDTLTGEQAALIPAVEYRLLATSKMSTMEKEVNEAALEGFRVDKVMTGWGMEILVVMSSMIEEDPGHRYEYMLLSTQKVDTMETELNEAAGEGFRYRAHAYYRKYASVMERDRLAMREPHEYKLLDTRRMSTMREEFVGAVDDGFAYLGLWGNDKVMLLHRPAELAQVKITEQTAPDLVPAEVTTAPTPSLEYRLLTEGRVSSMEEEMNRSAEEGFRLDEGYDEWTEGDLKVVMKRPGGTTPTERYEYRILATRKADTMEKELNEAAREGFYYKRNTKLNGEVVSYLERDSEVEAVRYEYKVLSTKKTSTLEKELLQATEEGFQAVALTVSMGGWLASDPQLAMILQRPQSQ